MLASRDRVTLVRSGKGEARNSLSQATVAAIESSGQSVQVLTSHSGTNKDTEAGSVTSFLARSAAEVKNKPSVFWIENASRLTLAVLCQLFVAIEQLGARLILSGDLLRKSDKRIDPLGTLEQRAGLRSAQVDEYRRIKAEERAARDDFKSGRTQDGFKRLENLGRVREEKTADIPRAVAAEYEQVTREGKSAWVVSNFDVAALNAAIRFALRRVLGLSRPYLRLERVWPSNPNDAKCYRRGQILVCYHNCKGFRAGHRYKIIGHDVFGHVLAREGAWVEAVPLGKAGHFGLFRPSKIELARGDRIRITANGRTVNKKFGIENLLSRRQRAVRIENHKMFGIDIPDRRYRVPRGSCHRIKGFTLEGDIRLQNGWVLPRKFAHIEHAYASVDPPPRGRSFNQVFVVQCGDKPDPEFAEKCFKSNGSKVGSVTVFTDDRERLRASMEGASRNGGNGHGTKERHQAFERDAWAAKTRERQEQVLERQA